MMTTKSVLIMALLALAGCVPATPIVSDYNGASVKIQTSTLADTGEADAVALAEASRICKTGGKRTAEPASSRMVDDYTVERLYLCL
jgi:hypothetical protein